MHDLLHFPSTLGNVSHNAMRFNSLDLLKKLHTAFFSHTALFKQQWAVYRIYHMVCIPNITVHIRRMKGIPQSSADVHVCIMFLSEVPYMSFGNGIGMQMGACVSPQCMLGVGVRVLCL